MSSGPSALGLWSRALVLVLGIVLLAGHSAGWLATAVALTTVKLHAPPLQSAIVLSLSLLVVRAATLRRALRRWVVPGALAVALAAFMVAPPFPERFEDNGLMLTQAEVASREGFENRFPVEHGGPVNFHSHLGDVLIGTLDSVMGRTTVSPIRAYDVASRLFGTLFILELAAAGAWHRWSRQSSRYIALALATPVSLLFFGFRDIGYYSLAAGAVPFLALSRSRRAVAPEAAPLVAGGLQGFHTAFHGFGMLGVAGGVLASLSGAGGVLQRLVRSATFASSAVALYLGWMFIYVTVAGVGVTWNRTLGFRPLFDPAIFENRVANPLFSMAGLGEFGLFSMLSGVPVLAIAALSRRRGAAVPAVMYSLPGLVYLVRWWPVSAPFNLDLLLSAFPGLYAACWAVATSRRRTLIAFVVLTGIHVVVWTTLGDALFARVWVTDLP